MSKGTAIRAFLKLKPAEGVVPACAVGTGGGVGPCTFVVGLGVCGAVGIGMVEAELPTGIPVETEAFGVGLAAGGTVGVGAVATGLRVGSAVGTWMVVTGLAIGGEVMGLATGGRLNGAFVTIVEGSGRKPHAQAELGFGSIHSIAIIPSSSCSKR